MSLNPDPRADRLEHAEPAVGAAAPEGGAASPEGAAAPQEGTAVPQAGAGSQDTAAPEAPTQDTPAPEVPTQDTAAREAPTQDTPPAPEDGQAPDPEDSATVTEAVVRVHRSPRYFRFMLSGAILLAIVALILTFAFPENPTYDRGSVFGFLLAVGVTFGVALGAAVALVVDRASSRRARAVQADRIDVRVSGPEGDAGAADERPSIQS